MIIIYYYYGIYIHPGILNESQTVIGKVPTSFFSLLFFYQLTFFNIYIFIRIISSNPLRLLDIPCPHKSFFHQGQKNTI